MNAKDKILKNVAQFQEKVNKISDDLNKDINTLIVKTLKESLQKETTTDAFLICMGVKDYLIKYQVASAMEASKKLLKEVSHEFNISFLDSIQSYIEEIRAELKG